MARKRAVGYCRVSTEDQAREGISLDDQETRIRQYCEFEDLELVELISDDGISAKNLKRPGIQHVLEMVGKKRIDALVVIKLDRAFRDAKDAINSMALMEKKGVEFHTTDEGAIDTENEEDEFMYILRAGLAQLERKRTAKRTKLALKHKRQIGEKTGGHCPFGFDAITETKAGRDGKPRKVVVLIENPAEQKAIALIRSLKLKRYTLRDICKELEARGVKTKTGRAKWHPKVIRGILAA